jgi:hypothetical protein
MSLLEQASLIITPNAVKEGKLFSIKPTDGSGDLSVVRATTKTRTNSLGVIENVPINVAALDYSNGSCPSILVEPQRTNSYLNSNSFTGVYQGGNVITSSEASPLNGINYLRFSEDTNTGQHHFERTLTALANTTYTMSIFVKKDERDILILRAANNAFSSIYVTATFNLTTGVATNGIMIPYQNGYRCIATFTTLTDTTVRIRYNINTTGNYNGIPGYGLYVTGAQLEVGSNATSYIPTVASAVTRNQDVISKTGISSLIGQTEGTVFVEFFYKNNFTELLNIQNTTSSFLMRTRIGQAGTNILSTIYANSGSFPLHPNYTLTPNSINKICIVYNYSNKTTKLFANGVLVGSTVGTNAYPTTSQDRIALGNFGGDSTESRFNIVNVFKTQLTDDECIALTTL